jgi:hypothetical protein
LTHPGIGPLTAWAFVLIIGSPERFRCGKQIGSYVGLIPCEDSSAGHPRRGHISKQGNALLRFLLAEAAQIAVRHDPDWRRRFLYLTMRRERRIAKVAMARKLAVRDAVWARPSLGISGGMHSPEPLMWFLALGCRVGFAFELSIVAEEVQTRAVIGKQVRGFR